MFRFDRHTLCVCLGRDQDQEGNEGGRWARSASNTVVGRPEPTRSDRTHGLATGLDEVGQFRNHLVRIPIRHVTGLACLVQRLAVLG